MKLYPLLLIGLFAIGMAVYSANTIYYEFDNGNVSINTSIIGGTKLHCTDITGGSDGDFCADIGSVNGTAINLTNICIGNSCISLWSQVNATDTNESARLNRLAGYNCTGLKMIGVHQNGTQICETDATGSGGNNTIEIAAAGFIQNNTDANINFLKVANQSNLSIQRPYDAVICKEGAGYGLEGCDVVCYESDNDCSDEIMETQGDNKKILLKSGNYTVTNLNITNTNIQILGEGRGLTIIKLANNSNTTVFVFNPNGNTPYPSYITISDLSIDGNNNSQSDGGCIYKQYSNYVTLERLKISNCYANAIRTLGSTFGHIVRDVQVYGSGGSADLYMGFSINETITDSLFSLNQGSGVMTSGGAQGVIIRNNRFIQNQGYATISLENSNDTVGITIEGNYFDNPSIQREIDSTGTPGSGSYNHIKIIGNTILNGRINLATKSTVMDKDFQIIGNEVIGSDANGIYINNGVDGVQILGNIVRDTDNSGIGIEGATNFNVQINDNIINNTGFHGIFFNSVKIGQAKDNILTNIGQAGSNIYDGIKLLTSSQRIEISGNSIVNMTSASIKYCIDENSGSNNIIEKGLCEGYVTGELLVSTSSFSPTYKYTTMPTCSTTNVFNLRTIINSSGSSYSRSTCVDNNWRVQTLDFSPKLVNGTEDFNINKKFNLTASNGNAQFAGNLTIHNGVQLGSNSSCGFVTTPSGAVAISWCD